MPHNSNIPFLPKDVENKLIDEDRQRNELFEKKKKELMDFTEDGNENEEQERRKRRNRQEREEPHLIARPDLEAADGSMQCLSVASNDLAENAALIDQVTEAGFSKDELLTADPATLEKRLDRFLNGEIDENGDLKLAPLVVIGKGQESKVLDYLKGYEETARLKPFLDALRTTATFLDPDNSALLEKLDALSEGQRKDDNKTVLDDALSVQDLNDTNAIGNMLKNKNVTMDASHKKTYAESVRSTTSDRIR